MYTEAKDGKYSVKTSVYELSMTDERIDFIVAGEAISQLRPVSAVNTCGDGDETNTDCEKGTPVLSASAADGVPTYTWTSASSLWDKKEYIIRCFESHFEYSIKLTGKGVVDTVNYFSGSLDSSYKGSEYDFDTGFTPINTVDGADQCRFHAMKSQEVFSYLMVPPMFVYSFTAVGVEPKQVFALAADRGEHNFTQFNYKTDCGSDWKRRFWFWTDQSGHVTVDGQWTTPRILGYTAASDMDALKVYADYYFANGIARQKDPAGKKPRFWYGPMACTWVEQSGQAAVFGDWCPACEKVCVRFVDAMEAHKLYPKILIVDDKWQECYGKAYPNKELWPDMRRYIDENLEKHDIHTMLWFKLWDREGFDDDMCMVDERENRLVVDPSNPKYRAALKDILYHLLSSDEGCCNAYGLKLDYAFWQPVGRKAKSMDGKYGVELLLELIGYIHDCVKEIKPEAIVNCSPCHPLFAEYADHARLHDYHPDLRRCFEEFKFRKEVYEIALPGALIDTDGAGFCTHRDTMRYMRLAPTIGIPDLYCFHNMPRINLNDDDWAEVASVWADYTARIDKMFE